MGHRIMSACVARREVVTSSRSKRVSLLTLTICAIDSHSSRAVMQKGSPRIVQIAAPWGTHAPTTYATPGRHRYAGGEVAHESCGHVDRQESSS